EARDGKLAQAARATGSTAAEFEFAVIAGTGARSEQRRPIVAAGHCEASAESSRAGAAEHAGRRVGLAEWQRAVAEQRLASERWAVGRQAFHRALCAAREPRSEAGAREARTRTPAGNGRLVRRSRAARTGDART